MKRDAQTDEQKAAAETEGKRLEGLAERG